MKNALKTERAKAGFTQADLAQKVQVSRQTIVAIEGGKYVPSTVLSLKVAQVFKVPVESIFELEKGD